MNIQQLLTAADTAANRMLRALCMDVTPQESDVLELEAATAIINILMGE